MAILLSEFRIFPGILPHEVCTLCKDTEKGLCVHEKKRKKKEKNGSGRPNQLSEDPTNHWMNNNKEGPQSRRTKANGSKWKDQNGRAKGEGLEAEEPTKQKDISRYISNYIQLLHYF